MFTDVAMDESLDIAEQLYVTSHRSASDLMAEYAQLNAGAKRLYEMAAQSTRDAREITVIYTRKINYSLNYPVYHPASTKLW